MIRALRRINDTQRSLLLIFINRFLKKGFRLSIYNIFLSVLIVLKCRLKKTFNQILHELVEIISPLIQLKPKFASGIVYLIPDFPKYRKSFTLGLMFLTKAIKNRKENSLNYNVKASTET